MTVAKKLKCLIGATALAAVAMTVSANAEN